MDHHDRVFEGPFRGSEALVAGLVTAGALRGPKYRRLLPDVYAPADLEPNWEARANAAHVWLAGRGVLGGYAAAEIYAAHCAPLDAPAEVIMRTTCRHAPAGLVVHRYHLAPDETRTYRGLGLTTPVRTAYDLARRCEQVDGIVAVDALCGRFGFKPDELLTLARRYPGARGLRRLSAVVSLAEPLSESAMETRLRLVIVGGGLPRPVAQHCVSDRRAYVVACVDLAYPEHRIAIEYEGENHFTRERAMRDVYRYTRLQDLGWRVYRYRSRDVYRAPDRIVAEIRRALSRPPP